MNALRSIANRRMAAVLLLGISSGIPLALVGSGSFFQGWMTDLKVDLTVIGIFALVSLPSTLKFLWAPAMDLYAPSIFGLGRRRGWILVTQIALVLAIAIMPFSNPATRPAVTAAFALLLAFFSASQDIVIDAYRVDVLNTNELGLGSAAATTGYRVGMIVSSGFALVLADVFSKRLNWGVESTYQAVYLLMAAAIVLGIGVTLFAPEPVVQVKPPRSLKDAVVEPFMDFFSRKGSIEIIFFTLLYKLDAVWAVALTTPFMMELGFTKTDVGVVTKGFGLAATIVGSIAGGAMMLRFSLKQALWVFGIVQSVSTLTFLYLAHVGHVYPVMVASIALENFFSGMGNAAYLAFIMSLCNPRFSATQFALLTSLMATTRVFLGSASGFMAKHLGWEMYYLVATLAAVPSLLLLLRYDRWKTGRPGI